MHTAVKCIHTCFHQRGQSVLEMHAKKQTVREGETKTSDQLESKDGPRNAVSAIWRKDMTWKLFTFRDTDHCIQICLPYGDAQLVHQPNLDKRQLKPPSAHSGGEMDSRARRSMCSPFCRSSVLPKLKATLDLGRTNHLLMMYRCNLLQI